jgi:hypothetical protein
MIRYTFQKYFLLEDVLKYIFFKLKYWNHKKILNKTWFNIFQDKYIFKKPKNKSYSKTKQVVNLAKLENRMRKKGS